MAGGLNRRQSAGAGGVTSLSRRECQGMFQCTPTKATKYEDVGCCCQFYCCAYAVDRGRI